MLTNESFPPSNPLRDTITNAYRMDETECLVPLITTAALPESSRVHIEHVAKQLVLKTREYKSKQGKIDSLLHQYNLSTDEGIALMCLAEALLRIPDKTTMDKFISDKISTVEWKNHISSDNSFFINATTWSLLLTGKVFSPALNNQKNLMSSLKRASSRLGASVIRPVILQMMKAIGKQFVMGETMQSALSRAEPLEKMGYYFSYDMLGEAARTEEDAKKYYGSYVNAINVIGASAKAKNPIKNPGISIKLSALYPRYEYTEREQVMKTLPALLLSLAQLAKKNNITLAVDAEEADRLDLSMDIFEQVYSDDSLRGWGGLGFVLQAYQKRAFYVIDWLADLAKQYDDRMTVRLVKGAYWDAEIKTSQVNGFPNYPVFTRKDSTDVSYLACAKKLLTLTDVIYPQFGTHNAYSVAAILEMAGHHTNFEFQCLHGMGRPLYDHLIETIVPRNSKNKSAPHVRIYAPVGTHKDLLGYLVRRLLENGANTSFVNQLSDETIPLDKIVHDPIERIKSKPSKPHPKIPLPKNIYDGKWENSTGIDLSDRRYVMLLKKHMQAALKDKWSASSIINGKIINNKNADPIFAPSNLNEIVGYAENATDKEVEEALQVAVLAQPAWGNRQVEERCAILLRAAQLFQQNMPYLITMLSREAGRCILDCIAEVREAIDYCRYYSYRAHIDLKPIELPGPTGEMNILSLHPRGVVACISPWNFPLAIFTGQIVASLLTGNAVIAKPAEQTPLIAFKAIQLLHEAGVPKGVLQLLIGKGETVGAKIVSDSRIAGVIFTGSTETAKSIERALAHREGPIAFLIAETGGQNAMIVDSSALPEQTVIDIAQSAFNSAGQRCSALRVLFVQEDIAPALLTMLQGYMAELKIGDPSLLETDIGPVIDQDALQMLQNHFARMSHEGKLLAQVPMPETLSGHYFAPAAFEINDLSLLKGEVFGPILHIIRYQAGDLDKIMDTIIQSGYGLTLGVHSRLDMTADYITSRMPIGNIYINRNMIGAVVGVQPFGGERLSGTGPKAGGPHYLPRLCIERSISINTVAVGGNAKLVSLLEED